MGLIFGDLPLHLCKIINSVRSRWQGISWSESSTGQPQLKMCEKFTSCLNLKVVPEHCFLDYSSVIILADLVYTLPWPPSWHKGRVNKTCEDWNLSQLLTIQQELGGMWHKKCNGININMYGMYHPFKIFFRAEWPKMVHMPICKYDTAIITMDNTRL